ncbi:hypothetical protein CISG_09013 [Coccidioides immitis RMSCC 3703]|uniref:DUF7779 domain-containing protein n=1 Tax=Coccidioides immitis RMSCC 3703 TaxID=454286 RepID=A0A0J8U3N3_COCIT|nr:hypothetical protein CISG_09013 [Coccidioides immitis RMSCC 3703]
MEMTSFGIFRRFVVKEQSALLCVPNEIPIGQFADHRSISRFSSVNDRNYRPVITRLLKFRQDITKKPAGFSHSSQDAQSPKSDFNSEPIFEIPFDRYFSFRGRQELIESMEKYFSQCSSSQPLIYALTGLGGSGKTHSALQYALRNRFKYKTGVVYFNASSNITLRADFHRIHDRLNLAPGGHSVEPLDEQTAVGLLLEKAAIGSPTVDNLKQATAVVRGLGYLPLAIDQAGAFIRRRQKSLKDYHRLFQDKQYEILNVAPGVSGYEKTVATLWELSFRQLEIAHPKASNLLVLFSFLEGNNISDTMLHRACSTKRIWGHNGETVRITPKDAGLNQELITLLDDEMQFDNAISQLLASSLIQRNATGESSTLSVHPLVQHCASHRVSLKERQKWRVQAILLVAHAFPFSVYVDENFGVIGREMFMHIPRILKEFDQLMPDGCDQYLIVKRAVTVLLLSAAKFNFNPWKNEFSVMAGNIGTGRRLRLALIESFIRRGLFTQAEEKLKELIPIIEAIPEPDINQSTEHFRVWAGLARISHLQGQWNEALDRWNQALAIVERSGWTQGFNHGIVLYSIAQVLARVGDVTGCQTSLSKAEKSLAVEERKYWIVGLGSYWYDYIVTALGSEGSSPVVNLEK